MNLLLFAIILLLYYCLHSLLASNTIKASLHNIISPRYYRIFYNIIAIGLLVFVGWTYFQVEKQILFSPPIAVTIAGWIVLVLGFILNSMTIMNYDVSEFFGTKYLKTTIPDGTDTLKTTGLNAIVRHPLYFSLLLVFWGGFLIKTNSAVLVIAAISTLYIIAGIYLEEKKLVKEYGQAYITYQKKVKMLIPYIF